MSQTNFDCTALRARTLLVCPGGRDPHRLCVDSVDGVEELFECRWQIIVEYTLVEKVTVQEFDALRAANDFLKFFILRKNRKLYILKKTIVLLCFMPFIQKVKFFCITKFFDFSVILNMKMSESCLAFQLFFWEGESKFFKQNFFTKIFLAVVLDIEK